MRFTWALWFIQLFLLFCVSLFSHFRRIHEEIFNTTVTYLLSDIQLFPSVLLIMLYSLCVYIKTKRFLKCVYWRTEWLSYMVCPHAVTEKRLWREVNHIYAWETERGCPTFVLMRKRIPLNSLLLGFHLRECSSLMKL